MPARAFFLRAQQALGNLTRQTFDWALHKGAVPTQTLQRSTRPQSPSALTCAPTHCADVQAHTVRDVAPKKLMLCCSFRLPASAALASTAAADQAAPHEDAQNDEERLAKRLKT